MSSVSSSGDLSADLKRADYLRRELVEFVTEGFLKEEYERQRKLFFELSDPADDSENESLLDWFLFDWFDERGQSVIDHFILSRPDLGPTDKDILANWLDSINSVFEIGSLAKNSLNLRELDSSDNFSVTTVTDLDSTPFRQGQYLAARLLPFVDAFIFSGVQFIMPDRQTALEALEMRRRIEQLDSPEAIEKARKEQCAAFCEFFGCEELSIPNNQLSTRLEAFQHYLFEGWRDPRTGMTRSESFRSQFGRDVNVPEMPSLPEIAGDGEVTILCDEFEGLVLLPDFKSFKQVFLSTSPDTEVPEWKELVWSYIKDPAIPTVAFSRVAEQQPARVEKVLRRLLGDKTFSIEHLYAVLLHYKEPVDGIDELKDDERLWDFFDGSANLQQRRASRRATPQSNSKSSSKPSSRTASPVKSVARNSKTASKTPIKPKAKSVTKATTTRASAANKPASNKRSASKRAKLGDKPARRPAARSLNSRSGKPTKKR